MICCPLCKSKLIRRDYAPSRGYILTLAGMAVLFVRSYVNPAILYPALLIEDKRLLVIGLGLFAYGMYCIFRHDNRYCDSCGYRFRKPCNEAPAIKFAEIRNDPASVESHSHNAKSSGDSTENNLKTLNPANLKPVLACLKFKNPQQRKQAAQTLREATGEDFGEDYQAWSNWLKENTNKSETD